MITITRYEPTPNPNALKCWLSAPLSDRPLSYRDPSAAAGDELATELFAAAGLTTLLINGDWMTINKPPGSGWATVKAAVERVLADRT